METTKMPKPKKKTPAAFCELIQESLRKTRYSNVKSFAEDAQISPGAAGDMFYGRWPGEPTKGKSLGAKRKWQAGKVYTMTRVCDFLELDLVACLEACGLPILETEIDRSRGELRPQLLLDQKDLEMLIGQCELIGKVPYRLIPDLVQQFREK